MGMMVAMDAETLLEQWLTTSTLRPSTQAEYQREIGSFLTWCASRQPPVDALAARPIDIAAWAHDCFLHEHLDGRPFDGPDALAWLAQTHPETARSHDRRITALTMYYKAAVDRNVITIPPNLAALRSGLIRPAGAKNKLNRQERVALFMAIGSWGPPNKNWQRDRLAVMLLLEGLRPSHVVRVTTDHLKTLPDGTTEVRAPDPDFEVLGPARTLDPMTTAALNLYLPVRPQPAAGAEHILLLSHRGQPFHYRWPNDLVTAMTATEPLLATREPPVTADVIAHTGLWDTGED